LPDAKRERTSSCSGEVYGVPQMKNESERTAKAFKWGGASRRGVEQAAPYKGSLPEHKWGWVKLRWAPLVGAKCSYNGRGGGGVKEKKSTTLQFNTRRGGRMLEEKSGVLKPCSRKTNDNGSRGIL